MSQHDADPEATSKATPTRVRASSSGVLLRSSLALAVIVTVLGTPFVVLNLREGRLLVGLASSAVLAVLALHVWTIIRLDRYYPTLTLLGLAPALLAFLTAAIRTQGVVGVLWCYPALLSFYVMLPERMAWLANAALLLVVLPAAWGAIDPALMPRMAVTLLIVSGAAAVFVRVIGSQRDKLAEKIEQLEASERRARDANQAKSAFLASMSHELRTPLNGVLGFAQLLARRRQGDREIREGMAVILRSGEHLLRLINDVLSLSKIEAGEVRMEARAFDPQSLLRDVEAVLRGAAEAKGLDLSCGTDGEAPFPEAVRGDAGRLRQILINLLGNAVKFTPRGTVRLRGAWRDGRAVFEVEDSGPGMSPAELESLFQPFRQTAAGNRSGEGTGLGLALSRDMARLMGGDVSVRSAAGSGTCFRVEVDLPAAPEGIDVLSPRRVAALAPDQPEYRILVVDDLADNRLVLSELLRSVGFEVREAANGAEAIETWRQFAPHVVWMDSRMPGMDGLEVTRRIREEEERTPGRRTVILALSASALEHEREEILAAGCDDFVAKPYSEAILFDRLSRHLGVRFIDQVSAPGEAPVAKDEEAPGPDRAHRGRVLLVDDDWISREVAHAILHEAGLQVAAASGGDEALRLLEAGPVDLVLTDLQMPGMDGRELARRVRSEPARRALPLVVMSAESPDDDRTAPTTGGFDAWVVKPVKPAALLETVHGLLRGARARDGG